MSFYSHFFFVCNRLHLIKVCLCYFLDMHLYSKYLRTIAIISSLTMSGLFPACFFCRNKFSLSHGLLAFSGKKKLKFPKP